MYLSLFSLTVFCSFAFTREPSNALTFCLANPWTRLVEPHPVVSSWKRVKSKRCVCVPEIGSVPANLKGMLGNKNGVCQGLFVCVVITDVLLASTFAPFLHLVMTVWEWVSLNDELLKEYVMLMPHWESGMERLVEKGRDILFQLLFRFLKSDSPSSISFLFHLQLVISNGTEIGCYQAHAYALWPCQ